MLKIIHLILDNNKRLVYGHDCWAPYAEEPGSFPAKQKKAVLKHKGLLQRSPIFHLQIFCMQCLIHCFRTLLKLSLHFR